MNITRHKTHTSNHGITNNSSAPFTPLFLSTIRVFRFLKSTQNQNLLNLNLNRELPPQSKHSQTLCVSISQPVSSNPPQERKHKHLGLLEPIRVPLSNHNPESICQHQASHPQPLLSNLNLKLGTNPKPISQSRNRTRLKQVE